MCRSVQALDRKCVRKDTGKEHTFSTESILKLLHNHIVASRLNEAIYRPHPFMIFHSFAIYFLPILSFLTDEFCVRFPLLALIFTKDIIQT